MDEMTPTQKWQKNNPWRRSYDGAKSRCAPNGAYYKRGTKFSMSVEEFKYLWFRDKAALMKRPSIDRIDSNGDYILSNCRFIELEQNRRRYWCKPVAQCDFKTGKIINKFATLWQAAIAMGVTPTEISRAAKGQRNIRRCKGFAWKFTALLTNPGGE